MFALLAAPLGLEISNAAAAISAPRAPVSLVNQGLATSTICLAEKPTRSALFAAAELREHLWKITGVIVPVNFDSGSTPAAYGNGTRILVGESLGTRQLGIKPSAFKSQEHLVRFLPKTVVLIGKDEAVETDEADAALQPELVAGKFGKAGRFGGKQRQSVSESGFDDKAGTFEGWVQLGGDSKDWPGIIYRVDGKDPWSYHILLQVEGTQNIAYRVNLDGKGFWSVTSKPLSKGWHFIQATHSAADNKIELFVDGVSQGTDKYLATTCAGMPLDIGGSAGAAAGEVVNAFAGQLDDLRISRTVRAPQLPQRALTVDSDTTFLNSFETLRRDIDSVRTLPVPSLYSERGTLNAAYDFLERFCGVRWYLPGDIGTTYTSTQNLQVSGAEIRRVPEMEYREMASGPLYLATDGAPVPERDAALWKLRMRLGGKQIAVGHSFEGYFKRFAKSHPDWFATQDESQSPQLNYSSPEVVQQVAQDARDFFDGKGLQPGAKGAGNYFSLVPMDTDLWTAADAAKFDKAEANNQQFSNGKASPVLWDFVNNVAREVGKTHPQSYMAALAYWEYAYPPKNMVLEPNISVQLCLHVRNWWAPALERNDRKMLNDWSKREKGKRPLYLWLYYCFPALSGKYGKYNEFPGFFSHTVVNQMKLYRETGMEGIFMEHSSNLGRSMLMDQVELYVTWKLADDASQNGDKLIDEFFQKYYGSAARPMQELYEDIESTFSDSKNYPQSIRESPGHQQQTEELAWKYLGTPERMARWDALMKKARAVAKSPVEKERVALFETSIWQPMQAGAERYRVTGPAMELAKAQKVPQVSVPAVANAAGDSSKVDWAKAFKVTKWSEVTGLPSTADIEMRLAHDGQYLYAELLDRRPEKELQTAADIFSGDDWEIFFAAQRERPYYQFAFNPAGTKTGLRWTGKAEYTEWDSGIDLQTSISAQGWVSRLALPLRQLLPGGYQKGKPVFINAYRNTPGGTALAWSPNFAYNFHDLGRMAEVTLE